MKRAYQRRPNSRGPDEPKCLRPGCERAQVRRGLCSTCLQSATKLVKEAKTTWASLEQRGKCLPKPIRETHAWFLDRTTETSTPDEVPPPLTSRQPIELGIRKARA